MNNPADRLARLFASALAVDAMAPGDFRRETDLSPVERARGEAWRCWRDRPRPADRKPCRRLPSTGSESWSDYFSWLFRAGPHTVCVATWHRRVTRNVALLADHLSLVPLQRRPAPARVLVMAIRSRDCSSNVSPQSKHSNVFILPPRR